MLTSPSLPRSPRTVPLTTFRNRKVESLIHELGSPVHTSSPIRQLSDVSLLAVQMEMLKLEDERRNSQLTEFFIKENSSALSPSFSSSGSSSSTTSPQSYSYRSEPVNDSVRSLRRLGNDTDSIINTTFCCDSPSRGLQTARIPLDLTPRVQAKPELPRFYFARGKPVPRFVNDSLHREVMEVFSQLPNQLCTPSDMHLVCAAADIPIYLKAAVYRLMVLGEERAATSADFTMFWLEMTANAHDLPSRFVYILSQGRSDRVRRSDFKIVLQDIILSHPGLAFFRASTDLHSSYCEIVVTRIYWNLKKAFSEFLTIDDVRRSDLLKRFYQIEWNEDINCSLSYFSYIHFYAIYCSFTDVDSDRDMMVNRADMAAYNDGAIPSHIVECVFSPEVCGSKREHLGLREFTHFLMADEDKTHPMSHIFWMRALDRDGMDCLTMHRIEVLHSYIQNKLDDEKLECMDFEDKISQMIDAIGPMDSTTFRLSDLRRSPRMAPMFLNSLVNWRKFLEQEITEVCDSQEMSPSGEWMTSFDVFCENVFNQDNHARVSSLSESEGSLL